MTKKQPLKPGDRCRAFDADGKYDGLITGTDENGNFIVDAPGSGPYHFHPRQCVRLKPRAPQQEERERVVCWAKRDDVSMIPKYSTRRVVLCQCTFSGGTRLVECSESEVVVSRESMAKAWDTSHLVEPSRRSDAFKQVCEALGLGLGKDA